MSVRSLLFVLTAGLVAAVATVNGQSDPRSLPLVDLTNVSMSRTWTWGQVDGAGKPMSYGAGASGVSEDGRYLYVSCQLDDSGIAKLEIPSSGASAPIVSPCAGPKAADIAKISPDPGAYRPVLGGVLEQGGRTLVTGYITYDAGGSATTSHWGGPSLTQLAGPFSGTVKPGLVKSQMAPVPLEWRQMLGGPAMASAGYGSIVSRGSYGASVSIFNPANVNGNGFPMTMLLGCPFADPATGAQLPQCISRWNAPTNNDYNGSEHWGGMFIVPGTRTLVAIEREASGPTCYGYATRNQALHGTPYPSASNPSPENVPWCYSMVDPLNQKAPMAYPYRLVAKLYDLADLVEVKQGRKQPWDIRQYATIDLPGSSPGELFISGAYNPVRGEYYLLRWGANGQGIAYVYTGFGQSSAPPTEICGDGIDNDGDGLIDEGCQTEVCGDGVDNDGDGLIDEGCPAEVCGDGIDNDGDGFIDEGCATEVCGDGIDNDHDGRIDEGCESTGAVPGEPHRLYGSVKRNAVTLKWFPPLTGGAVAEYVIEAGLSPGDTFYSTPVGMATSLNVPHVGTGRYYVRVRGKNANGLGKPSNEVALSVGCRTKPSRLSGLSATSKGSLVTLTWTDPDGCSGTTYTVAVGATQVSTDQPSTTTVLPQGNYVARVVAQTDTGTSEPTEVQFTVNSGTCAPPQFRLSARSVVAGRRVGVFWSPLEPDLANEDDRLSPIAYLLEAGTAPGASDIGVLPMARATQFITDAPAGTYYVRVRPTNACGGGRVSQELKLVVR